MSEATAWVALFCRPRLADAKRALVVCDQVAHCIHVDSIGCNNYFLHTFHALRCVLNC